MPHSISAAPSLALPSQDYPHATQVVVLPATNAEADRYFGPVHRSPFERLHRIDGAGWMQAGVWHFTTGRGGAARRHTTVFAYGIHVFSSKAVAHKALLDVKLKTKPTRVSRLYARRYTAGDAQRTLIFLFFTYHDILIETYVEYGGVAPAKVSTSLHDSFGKQAVHLAGLARKLYKTIHRAPTETPLPLATSTSVPTETPTETPIATDTATTAPMATTIPTATVAPTATATLSPTPSTLTLQAKLTSPTYPPSSYAVAHAHLSQGGEPVVGATVSMTFYLPQSPVICSVLTDANGDASCSAAIQGDTPVGTHVDVIVGAQAPNGETATAMLSFTVKS